MSAEKIALVAVGLGAVALALSRAIGETPAGQLSIAEVKSKVRKTLSRGEFPNVTDLHLRTIVEIESNRKPFALRTELRISDFSAGLTQTLVRTAADMHDKGFRRFPRVDFAADDDKYSAGDIRRVTESPAARLFNPDHSLYLGAAYSQWLTTHSWYNGTLQWQTRGYNGGPGGATNPTES